MRENGKICDKAAAVQSLVGEYTTTSKCPLGGIFFIISEWTVEESPSFLKLLQQIVTLRKKI